MNPEFIILVILYKPCKVVMHHHKHLKRVLESLKMQRGYKGTHQQTHTSTRVAPQAEHRLQTHEMFMCCLWIVFFCTQDMLHTAQRTTLLMIFRHYLTTDNMEIKQLVTNNR